MDQSLINWLLAGFGALIGFLLRAIWQAVKDLQSSDKEIIDRVSKIETLVVGQYITRDELNITMKTIRDALNRIEDKLDKKADK